jgi:[calcium/calmodulin-dependent protein kinase] kinase
LDDTTNVLYILLELAKSDWNREIRLRAKNNSFYSEPELLIIFRQLIYALCYLQENNIAHRDIKPHNILIFDKKVYKLADFGEAKIIKLRNKKQMGTLRGTELYMAPILFNSLENGEIVEHNPYKSDVYSLGYCVLLAATLSFESLFQIRKLTNKKQILDIVTKEMSSHYSDKLIQLVCRMLDLNEKFRFDFLQLKEFFENSFGK